MSAISEIRDLALLNDSACDNDNMLAAKVKKEMDSRTYNITDWKASGSANIWAGYDNKSGVKSKGCYNSARFTVSDHADVHLGNTNTGG